MSKYKSIRANFTQKKSFRHKYGLDLETHIISLFNLILWSTMRAVMQVSITRLNEEGIVFHIIPMERLNIFLQDNIPSASNEKASLKLLSVRGIGEQKFILICARGQ